MHKRATSAAKCIQQVEQLQTVAMLLWLSATLQSIVPARYLLQFANLTMSLQVCFLSCLLAVDQH